jgi:hypothetical protein
MNPVWIETTVAETPLLSNIQHSDQITFELWIRPAATSTRGFNQIAALAARETGLTLGVAQDGSTYLGQLGLLPDDSSTPMTATGSGLAQRIMQHVVFTYNQAEGRGYVYINGYLAGSQDHLSGVLEDWTSDAVLMLANLGDSLDDAAWRGDIYTFAIYDRALSEAEVAQNYQAGEA